MILLVYKDSLMNKSKAKGTSFETDCVNYANEQGYEAIRKVLSGAEDKGDIQLRKDIILECKAAVKFDLSGWMEETNIQKANSKSKWAFLVVKRPRKNVSKSYAIIEYDQLLELLKKVK